MGRNNHHHHHHSSSTAALSSKSSPPQFLDVRLANGLAGVNNCSSSAAAALLGPALSSSSSSTSSVSSTFSSWSTGSSATSSASTYLSPRDEPTRVQLQRQRLYDQRAAASVSKSLPGFKTSAAFFASLRTNLRLAASPPASPVSTPGSMRASLTSLPPPSPLAVPVDIDDPIMSTSAAHSAPVAPPTPSALQDDPLAGVPDLTSYTATTADDQIDALKLVADSVAQQRQTANSTLIFHPLHLAVVAALLGVVVQTLRTRTNADWITIGITCVSIIMSGFAAVRYLTQGYLWAAERINVAWLENGGEEDPLEAAGSADDASSADGTTTTTTATATSSSRRGSHARHSSASTSTSNGLIPSPAGGADHTEIRVTRFGDEVIGAIVVRWVSGDRHRGNRGDGRRKKAWRGRIIGWAVRLRYRGKGVGTALLEDLVAEARRKGAEGLEFSGRHANSLRVLPAFYNGVFDKREERHRARLEELWTGATGGNSAASGGKKK